MKDVRAGRENEMWVNIVGRKRESATATGVESGKNVGFVGVTEDLVAGNNNNLA